jgi:ribosome-binding protein aMBF1 (putative translation factor)
MMAKSFSELAARAKASWSDEDHAIFEAASTAFVSEAAVQAELGAKFATARSGLDLSQQRLSEMTGIQQSEISRIERGVSNPTTLTLARLAGALGQEVTLTPRKSR